MNFTGNINDIQIQLKRLSAEIINQQKTIASLLDNKKYIILDGAGLPSIADDSIQINSVNGLTDELNNKSAVGHSHEVQELLQSGAATGQIIRWTGTEWAPETVSFGSAGVFDLDGGTATVYTGTPDIDGGGA